MHGPFLEPAARFNKSKCFWKHTYFVTKFNHREKKCFESLDVIWNVVNLGQQCPFLYYTALIIAPIFIGQLWLKLNSHFAISSVCMRHQTCWIWFSCWSSSFCFWYALSHFLWLLYGFSAKISLLPLVAKSFAVISIVVVFSVVCYIRQQLFQSQMLQNLLPVRAIER